MMCLIFLYQKRKIQEYSELIRDKDIEHAYIIDRFGNVFYSVGGTDNVLFEGIDLANPNVKELLAVNVEYTYSVKVLKSLDNLSYSELYREALEEVDIMTAEDIDFQHEVFVLLDKKGYVKYERKKYR